MDEKWKRLVKTLDTNIQKMRSLLTKEENVTLEEKQPRMFDEIAHIVELDSEPRVFATNGRWDYVLVKLHNGESYHTYFHVDCDSLTEHGKCIMCHCYDPPNELFRMKRKMPV